MEFTSSPLGMLYASLRKAAAPKAGQNLDQCELRADSKTESDLRVKTGDRSGWSSKARRAHQTNAMVIVGRTFSASMEKLLRERKDLAVPTQQAIRNAGTVHWNTYIGKKGCVTLGDVRDLHARAVRVFHDQLPETPAKNTSTTLVIVQPSSILPASGSPTSPSAMASASSSSALSSSGAAQSRHWTVVSPTSPASTSAASASSLASSLSSPAPSSSSASASPVASSTSPSVAALTVLKALYPVEKFPTEHGENDAASRAKRQANFHAKLDVLVEIAARCAPTLLDPVAERGGYRILKTAAQSMKFEPHLEPAVALYKQTVGPTHDRIAAVYRTQVDGYVNSSEYRK